MEPSAATIEPSDPSSWPPEVRAWVEDLLVRDGDLDVYLIEEEAEFFDLLAERPLHVYHASRLLEYELDWIRARGLRRLTREFLEERIETAHARGHLSEKERQAVLAGNAYAVDNAHGRDGRIGLIAGRAAFDKNARGVNPLLGTWGGEGIHGYPLPGREAELRVCGLPTIVAVRFRVADRGDRFNSFPALARVFLENFRAPGSFWADIIFQGDIDPDDIVGIWQPGDPEFDRHRALTRI